MHLMGAVKPRRSRSATQPIRCILFCFVHPWRYATECIMWSVVVVVLYPLLCYGSYFINGVEQVSIQHTLPVSSIEAFYKGILCRLTRLNILELNFIHFAPLLCYLSYELRSVVHAYFLRLAIAPYQMSQYPND